MSSSKHKSEVEKRNFDDDVDFVHRPDKGAGIKFQEQEQVLIDVPEKPPATFEDVVSYLGFGKYNVILIALTTMGMFCNNFETTSMSYIFTSAKCDLELSLQDKGYLNSAVYIGMMSSALIWGYLGDTFGRRNILLMGFGLDFLVVVAGSFSQNLTTLLVCKFLGGFIINGPFAAMTTYLSEFHSSRYRPRIQLYYGCMISVGMVILPLLAWALLTQNWDFHIFNGYFTFHPWNIFLLFCSLPSFVSTICLLFLPESPKFLMSSGRNDDAMKIFRKIYAVNTGKHPDTFPFKELIDEKKQIDKTEKRNLSEIIGNGFSQMKPLFEFSLMKKLLLISAIQCLILQSQNMIRLWIPQIFQAYGEYAEANNGTSSNLCSALPYLRGNDNNTEDAVCVMENEHSAVYLNSLIISSCNTISYVISGSVIQALGKKRLLIIGELIAGAAAIGLYFSPSQLVTTVLFATFTSLQLNNAMVILNVTVDVFPTAFRTLTVSVVMMIGRVGAVVGNIIFPMLLSQGCALPFFVVGSISLGSGILCFLLPYTENRPLQ